MACCYIAAFCVGQLVKACQFLDLDEEIRYNDDGDSSAAKITTSGTESSSSDPLAVLLSLDGLTCSACSTAVEDAILKLEGVSKVRVSLALQQASVISDGERLDQELILRTVRDLGYGAEIGVRTPKQILELLQAKDQLSYLSSTISQLVRGITVLQLLSWSTSLVKGSSFQDRWLLGLIHAVSLIIIIFIQFFCVSRIHQDGWKWLQGGSVNMNSLASMSMGLGTLLSLTDLTLGRYQHTKVYYSNTVGLALVIVSGRYLDALSRRSGSSYLIRLYKSLTEIKYATLYPSKQVVPSDYLRPSDEIIIEPFSEVPCDCYIVHGTSLINQAVITGESLPVKRSIGECLLGGTLNQGEQLRCVVRKGKEDSFHAQLVQLSSESTSTHVGNFDFVEVAMRYFVTFIMVLSLATSVYQATKLRHTVTHYELFRLSVSRLVTMLTSACPCALGLAIPSAVLATVSSAGKKGILITGGIQTIQKLQDCQTIVFDKTGTLTEATFEVENFNVEPPWIESKALLWQYICALEEHAISSNPIARAIFRSGIQYLGNLWIENQLHQKIKGLVKDTGRGIGGHICLNSLDWHHVIIGSTRYLDDSSVAGMPHSARLPVHGMIAVHIALDAKYAGTIYLGDIVRSEAKNVVHKMISSGYHCGILTGDKHESALRVSKLLNMPILRSEARPVDKLNFIQCLQSSGQVVAMVGDGLNDAPSLRCADVGVSFHRDSASNAAGAAVIILNSQLESIPWVYGVAKIAMKQIRFNLCWVMGYNFVVLALASGLVKPFGSELTPPTAAMMMAVSSVCISWQSLRLQNYLGTL